MGRSIGSNGEKPVHSVTLTYDFWLGKYEVTFEEYDQYCEETGTSKESDRKWGRGKRPVIYVSWNEAIKYCNWLSKKEGLTAAYDSSGNLLDKNGNRTTEIKKVEGYRLPSEAEWEYAARGGTKSKGYTYSGSNSLGDVGWYNSNSGGKIHEVGEKKANELGIYDMSGNVWEWCQDWYDSGYYGESPSNDPVNFDSASSRVVRGGGWSGNASGCRVARRGRYAPSGSYFRLGFRVARTRFF
jgi:formylglycine-generating enzyme required for sulfatase activity